jgi:ubiquinone/menaquinone biosynthesis C-methylase UbiE
MNKKVQIYKATMYFVRNGTVGKVAPKTPRVQRETLDLLAPHEGELVLDAGIGTGFHAGEIIRRGSRVVGKDVSREMLSKCAQINDQIDLVLGDIQQMPFREGAFDKFFCVRTLLHVPDYLKATSKIIRVTKEGGVTLIEVFNTFHISCILQKLSHIISGTLHKDGPIFHTIS